MTNQPTTAQIEAFISTIDDEFGYGIDESAVVTTADTLPDFTAQWGRADEVREGVHMWESVQAAKGQPRKTLFVRDLGDVRLAATC